MSIKISQFKDNHEEFIVIDFPEPPKIEKKDIDLSKIIPEINEYKRKNIAVNTEEKFQKEISTEEYVKQLKEELNIHDPEEGWQKKLEDKYKTKNVEEKEQLQNPKIKPDETNVTYSIKNRFARFMYIPVYKCKGRGVVVVNIAVDDKGYVVNAEVEFTSTNTDDECLHNEAIDAAKRSRFNADYSAPARQKGTITYKFVAQ